MALSRLRAAQVLRHGLGLRLVGSKLPSRLRVAEPPASSISITETERQSAKLSGSELLALVYPAFNADTVPATSVVFPELVSKWKANIGSANMNEIIQMMAMTVYSVNQPLDEFFPALIEEFAQRVEKADDQHLAQAFMLLSRRHLKWFYPDLVSLLDRELFHRTSTSVMQREDLALAAEALYQCGQAVKKPYFHVALMSAEAWSTPEYAMFQYVAYCDSMSTIQLAKLAEKFLTVVDLPELSPHALVCVAEAFLYCKGLIDYVPQQFFADLGAHIDLMSLDFVEVERLSSLLQFGINFNCIEPDTVDRIVQLCEITEIWPIVKVANFVYALSHLKHADEVRHYPVLSGHRRRLELHEVAGQFHDVLVLFTGLAHIGVDVPKWSAVVCQYLKGNVDLVARSNAADTMRLLTALSEIRVLSDELLESFFRVFSIVGLDFSNVILFCVACTGQLGMVPDRFWNSMVDHCTAGVVETLPSSVSCALFWLNFLASRQHLPVLDDQALAKVRDCCAGKLTDWKPLRREFHKEIEEIVGGASVRRDMAVADGVLAPLALLVDTEGVPCRWPAAAAASADGDPGNGGDVDPGDGGDVDVKALEAGLRYPVVVRLVSSDECVMLRYGGVGGGSSSAVQDADTDGDGNQEDSGAPPTADTEFALRRHVETELLGFEAVAWIPAVIPVGSWWTSDDKAGLLRSVLREKTRANLEERLRRERELLD